MFFNLAPCQDRCCARETVPVSELWLPLATVLTRGEVEEHEAGLGDMTVVVAGVVAGLENDAWVAAAGVVLIVVEEST